MFPQWNPTKPYADLLMLSTGLPQAVRLLVDLCTLVDDGGRFIR